MVERRRRQGPGGISRSAPASPPAPDGFCRCSAVRGATRVHVVAAAPSMRKLDVFHLAEAQRPPAPRPAAAAMAPGSGESDGSVATGLTPSSSEEMWPRLIQYVGKPNQPAPAASQPP